MKVVLRLLACILTSVVVTGTGFSQMTQWIRPGVSSNVSGGIEIVADKSGSSYVYGTFTGTITFGAQTLNSGTTQNHFLVKYSGTGTPIWAQRISGDPVGAMVSEGYLSGAAAYNLAITSDYKGGIYIAGRFGSTVTIGTRTLTATSPSLFVAKLDTNGNVLWLIKGGANSATPAGMVADSLGNIYLTGYWETNTPFQFGPSSIAFSGSFDIFLVKIRQDSTVVWAKSVRQSDRYELATSIAADKTGAVYLTGECTNPLTSSIDAYLVKVDSSGTIAWQQHLGTQSNHDYGLSVIVDPEKNIFVSGTINSIDSAKFDTIIVPFSTGQIKRFIAKFNNAGKALWLWLEKSVMTTGHPRDMYLTSDMQGNVYFGGSYRDSLALEPFKLRSNPDVITAYTGAILSTKQFLWAKKNTVQQQRRSQIYAVSCTPFGDLFACGIFADSISMDTSIAYGTGVNAFAMKIVVPWIFTETVHGSPFCPGYTAEVPFTLKGDFPENVIFYLQLSDSLGSFTKARTIDSMFGASLPLFSSKIPHDVPPGTKYRLRVICKTPYVIGLANAVDLRINAAPKISFTPSSPIRVCNLDSPVNVTVTAPGGTSFEWEDIGGATTRKLAKAGWYYIRVENATGCMTLDSVQVVDLPPVVATITPSREIPICIGSNVDLVASGGASYLWSNGDTTKTINVDEAGIYRVTVVDSFGCLDTTSITVTTKPGPQITMSLEEDYLMCTGDSVTLTASESPNYLWSTGDTTRAILVKTPGSYYVSTADSNCRGYSKTIAVGFHPTPAKPTISRNENILSTTAPPPLKWFFNGTLIDGETSQSITATAEGTYTVEMTDSNGCVALSNGFPFAFVGVDLVKRYDIRLQPNPARDYVTLHLSDPGRYRVTLYDLLGKKVADLYAGYTEQPQIELPISSSIDAGSYILRIAIDEATIRSFTLIKE